jgi:DNA-binding LytR/AlgR family response regulator
MSQACVRCRELHFASREMQALTRPRGLGIACIMRLPQSYIPTRETWPVEIALVAGVGVFFALAGLFDSSSVPFSLRIIYWVPIMLSSGAIIITVETLWHRFGPTRLQGGWTSLAVVTFIVNTVQTAVVAFFQVTLVEMTARANDPSFVSPDAAENLAKTPLLWGMVLIVVFPMVALMRALRVFLRQRKVHTIAGPVDNTTPPALIIPHLGVAMRNSTLLALRAEDHYVRVYTAAGNDLVLLRFSDTLNSVSDRAGFQLHRSWWVAETAIQSASFRDGKGEVSLAGDITAPVSRTYVRALREAGWLG